MDSGAQGRDGTRLGSRLRARRQRQWAALGSAAVGLRAVIAQARSSDCCARLMVAQGKNAGHWKEAHGKGGSEGM